MGNVFSVPNEILASMIVLEWEAQREKIARDHMHLTALANTVLDETIDLGDEKTFDKLLSYLEFDTVCYRNSSSLELLKLQNENLDPIVQWFANRFDCSIAITETLSNLAISNETKNILRKYLKSLNKWSLMGVIFAAENLKSLILTCALINRFISVQDAVRLSRIEENYQASIWKSIESHHDLERYSLEARVSAAIIFILLNLEKNYITNFHVNK